MRRIGRTRAVLMTLVFLGCGSEEREGPRETHLPGPAAPIPSSGLTGGGVIESLPAEPGELFFPETESLLAEVQGTLADVQADLARKAIPNLVKSFDSEPPIDYDADYAWHSLKKEKECPLPRSGALGLINPNTELNYLIGFDPDGKGVRYDSPSTTILHGVDYLAERVDLGEGLTGTVTFLPYDSGLLMAFIELANRGDREREVRVHQLVEKEVFQYRPWPSDPMGRVQVPESRRMSGVWVGTRGMKRAQELPDGSALVFKEWEGGRIAEAGELLVLVGGDRNPEKTWTESPPNTQPAPEPGAAFEPSVFHRAVRVYGVRIPAGGTGRIAGFLVLRRYSDKKLVGPRGVRPYLLGDEPAALSDCRKRIADAFRVDWRQALSERVGRYQGYPKVSLPDPFWERAFLACLELPRAETVSPFGTMPIPFYNFCRAYGNEPRQWWSYGEHGHESLSTFVTCLTDPALARTHLRGHIVNQDPDGGFPYGVNQQSRPGIRSFAPSQVTCPFITWEAWNAYLWSGDRGFLREAFEASARSHDWWLRTRDRTGEGLCCWLDFGETVRDDGTVPTWRYEGAPVFFQEALDLNCYLLNQEQVLAEMAAELGGAEQAKEFREAWRKRARAVNAYLWDPEDQCYYGASEISDVLVKVKDIGTLLPLWCGAAPVERAGRLFDLYRDPKHFATAWPVPVLAASDPLFFPDGHWHGGNWVEMSWLVVLGLKNYGWFGEAARLAERNVTMVFRELERASHLREYFNSDTGRGLSLFDYIWTAMPGIMIVDVFLGVRPARDGLEILPALPEGWTGAGIRDLNVRGKRLHLEVKRSASASVTSATVSGASRPVTADRGVRIGWDEWARMPDGGVTVEIVQPPAIAERIAPPRPLPEDVLEPLPAHVRIEPTTAELSFRSHFMHYAVDPVPYIRPPSRR